jgi:hypothetical protein
MWRTVMNKDMNEQGSITATALNESQRLRVLPELFDQHMMHFEGRPGFAQNSSETDVTA